VVLSWLGREAAEQGLGCALGRFGLSLFSVLPSFFLQILVMLWLS
jgi:hypothetical protein